MLLPEPPNLIFADRSEMKYKHNQFLPCLISLIPFPSFSAVFLYWKTPHILFCVTYIWYSEIERMTKRGHKKSLQS